jgi:hypothetical protein
MEGRTRGVGELLDHPYFDPDKDLGAVKKKKHRGWRIHQCRVLPSHKKSPTTLSTSYTTNAMLSKRVVSSLDHGFHAPENTFSMKWLSIRSMISRLGTKLSRIPSIRLGVIPALCPSATHMKSLVQLELQTSTIGSAGTFQMLCG